MSLLQEHDAGTPAPWIIEELGAGENMLELPSSEPVLVDSPSPFIAPQPDTPIIEAHSVSTYSQQRAVHLFVMQQLFYQYMQTLQDFKKYIAEETANFNKDMSANSKTPVSEYGTQLPTKLKQQISQFQTLQKIYEDFKHANTPKTQPAPQSTPASTDSEPTTLSPEGLHHTLFTHSPQSESAMQSWDPSVIVDQVLSNSCSKPHNQQEFSQGANIIQQIYTQQQQLTQLHQQQQHHQINQEQHRIDQQQHQLDQHQEQLEYQKQSQAEQQQALNQQQFSLLNQYTSQQSQQQPQQPSQQQSQVQQRLQQLRLQQFQLQELHFQIEQQKLKNQMLALDTSSQATNTSSQFVPTSPHATQLSPPPSSPASPVLPSTPPVPASLPSTPTLPSPAVSLSSSATVVARASPILNQSASFSPPSASSSRASPIPNQSSSFSSPAPAPTPTPLSVSTSSSTSRPSTPPLPLSVVPPTITPQLTPITPQLAPITPILSTQATPSDVSNKLQKTNSSEAVHVSSKRSVDIATPPISPRSPPPTPDGASLPATPISAPDTPTKHPGSHPAPSTSANSQPPKQKPMKFHMVNYKKRPLSELDDDTPTLQRSQSLLPSMPHHHLHIGLTSDQQIQHQLSHMNQQFLTEQTSALHPTQKLAQPAMRQPLVTSATTKLRIYPELLTMKQSDAAKILGISASMLSKRWREAMNGKKWPYRVHRKMQKELDTTPDDEDSSTIVAMSEEYIEI